MRAQLAVEARLTREAAAAAPVKKAKKQKKEKPEKDKKDKKVEVSQPKVENNSLTSDALIDWRLVRLNQLLVYLVFSQSYPWHI